MHGREAVGDREEHVEPLAEREPASDEALEVVRQGHAGDVLHHHVLDVVLAPDGVDADDARVTNRGERLSLGPDRERNVRPVGLDRDAAREVPVVGVEDLAHASFAEDRADLVRVTQHRARPEDVNGRRFRRVEAGRHA